MLSAADLRDRFEGRLVVLEPLALSHADGLFEVARADRELFRWMPLDLSESPEALRGWVVHSVESGEAVPFTILDRASGVPVGSTRFLELRFEHLRVEIGWTWLARSVWGTGANVECKLLLLTRAFERLGLRRVEFKADARNERSRGALHALGAQFEGVMREHMVLQDGSSRDSAYYSVIDDEWPAVKAGLERRLEDHLRVDSSTASSRSTSSEVL
ncbi:MAG: GNAT family N-acetyltransferase [Solirubrobacterales bacterium]|nr:GNAT family N-acetyltransferase [Solirubrobacterales bacterium]MBV9049847.1 GNAT family N-acetyltransferase [Solirubrobacterales bacterium]